MTHRVRARLWLWKSAHWFSVFIRSDRRPSVSSPEWSVHRFPVRTSIHHANLDLQCGQGQWPIQPVTL